MSNLEKLIKFAREKKATDFKSTFADELATRVSTKLDAMKQTLAKTMFAKEEVELDEEDEDITVYDFTEEQWNELTEEEQSEFEDFDVDGEYDAENGYAVWVVGEQEFDVIKVMDNDELPNDSGEPAYEAAGYKSRSRRQVHMTQIRKRRLKGRNRAKKLRTNIKRRKAGNRIKIKRNRLKITRRYGAGDKSGRSGKIGAARKRRGGRTISHKG
jgi:hypothetical protein